MGLHLFFGKLLILVKYMMFHLYPVSAVLLRFTTIELFVLIGYQ